MDRLEQLLERGARRHRDRLAAVCGKAELTYGELDLASNALAQRLLDAGVSADHRVGLYLAKGVGSVTALYGVLKTGAAYVPLDPTGPLARRRASIWRPPRVFILARKRWVRFREMLLG